MVKSKNSKNPMWPHLNADFFMLCGLAAVEPVCAESVREQSEFVDESYWQRTKGTWLRFLKQRIGCLDG